MLDTTCWWKPTFSPDGQKILASGRNEEKKTASIVVFSLEGEILQEYDIGKYFTADMKIYSPDWSPDGKQLVFITRNVKYETYLIKNVLK